ncbi:hypothetical protein, partial [Lapidilactobacillus concavus]|uniref:hypothetical protein n=1 Tax=Lapidilactobacillus concavus TaxID=287844 RepID=UPI001C994D9B
TQWTDGSKWFKGSEELKEFKELQNLEKPEIQTPQAIHQPRIVINLFNTFFQGATIHRPIFSRIIAGKKQRNAPIDITRS